MTRSGCDDEADGVDGIWLDGAWLGVRMEFFFFGKDLCLWSSCMSASRQNTSFDPRDGLVAGLLRKLKGLEFRDSG